MLHREINSMKLVYSLLGLSLVLGGCSSSGVLSSMGMGSSAPAPASSNVQVGNALAMPPDLKLPAPGTNTSAAYEPNTAASAQAAALDQPIASAPAPRAAVQDVYARYGISKVKPDGTPKTDQELKAELKLAVLNEKRQKQPGYGTINNIGNIFSDG
jgi:hypothetical protein